MTTTTLSYKAIHSKVTSLPLPKISWRVIYFSGILLSILLLVFYIYSINKLTEGVYLIKNYNKEVNNVLEENKVLENKFANSSFFGVVQDRVKEMNFEKTVDVKYIQILDNSLVRAQPR